MQAVADAHVLEVAEPGVERGERLLRRLRLGGAFRDEARGAPAFEDQRGDGAGAARIEPLRLGVFVVEAFELERRPVRAGGDQRRGQMADGRRADAPLGLRRLAGIVDDERIDDRRRAEENFGRAAFGQRDRLARQPFERAVRAELDQRVDPLLGDEPDMKRDVAVAGRQGQVVVVALAARRIAAVGLNRDDQPAEPDEAEAERAADAGRIGGRIAPGGLDRLAKVAWRRGERGLVVGQRQDGLERPLGERGDQRSGVAVRDVVAGRAENLGDGGGARRRIEADGVAGAPAARRIVRQHAGEALLRRGLPPQAPPSAPQALRRRRRDRGAAGGRPR